MMAMDQAGGEQRLQELLEAFSGIAQLESKMIMADLEPVKLDKLEDTTDQKDQANAVLTSICQEFLLNFAEEIASQTSILTE